MLLLLGFAFVAGIVTVLSPCILPILPIILSSSIGGRAKPYGIVLGFVTSFTVFTLFLTAIVKATGIPADSLRSVSILILFGFGLSLLFPKFQEVLEIMFSKFSRFVPDNSKKSGFGGGFVIGLSVGLLWTPCVGPILASVISLALTGEVTVQAFLITLAYSLGTAIPMFLIMTGGRKVVEKINPVKIQKMFGVIMILTAIGIYFNVDRKFQTWVLDTFPNYGTNLTKFEEKVFEKEEKININTAPELIPGGSWFGSAPLTIAQLRGKVVLVDFWTYTCINCQRTFPYLRTWHEKYKDQGLVIIGVHSPEFEFEKDPKNLAVAIKDFQLPYPIVQDNDFATLRAYNNRYWQAKYLIDKNGVIRYTHFGEGAYDETEKIIQTLLEVEQSIENPKYKVDARTPELYLGLDRRGNQVVFAGVWDDQAEYTNPKKGASLSLNFEAKEVFLVMNSKDKPAVVKVYLDNVFVKNIVVDSDKLYTILELETAGKHLLKLEFEDDNAELYAFTFG